MVSVIVFILNCINAYYKYTFLSQISYADHSSRLLPLRSLEKILATITKMVYNFFICRYFVVDMKFTFSLAICRRVPPKSPLCYYWKQWTVKKIEELWKRREWIKGQCPHAISKFTDGQVMWPLGQNMNFTLNQKTGLFRINLLL